mmetsp:Transcript_42583/g.120312  ORF Transcript_42583/g.120312 Transcript_42583/m.120312 type:complete len:232 (+) Transcript_42583:877-1572(+)
MWGLQLDAARLPRLFSALHPVHRRALLAEDGPRREHPRHAGRRRRLGGHHLLRARAASDLGPDARDHGPWRRPGRRHRAPRRGHGPSPAGRRIPQPRRRCGRGHRHRVGALGARLRAAVQHLDLPRGIHRGPHGHGQLVGLRQAAGPHVRQVTLLPGAAAVVGVAGALAGRGHVALHRDVGDQRPVLRHRRLRGARMDRGGAGRRRGHARGHHPFEQRLRLGPHGRGLRAV